MSEDVVRAEGVNGQVELRGGRIRITRKGVFSKLAHGLKGEKEILVSKLVAVQFKRAGCFTNGYIQFVFGGSDEDTSGLFAATQDENTVMFRAGAEQQAFFRLKQAIEKRMTALGQRGDRAPSRARPTSGSLSAWQSCTSRAC